MSKKVEYKCNLCHQEKKRENLRAMYWTTVKNEDNYKAQYVLTDSIDLSGTHICFSCIEVVKGYVNPLKQDK